MSVSQQIITVLDNEKSRRGELLLDILRLNPKSENEFWETIGELCLSEDINKQAVALAVFTHSRHSLSNRDLDTLIGRIDENYNEYSKILPYVLTLIRINQRNDKILFCHRALEWSKKENAEHVRFNAQRCLDTLGIE